VLIETVLPVFVTLLPKEWLFNRLKWAFARWRGAPLSRARWLAAHAPPRFRLEIRCASLMRSVVLCCAFSAGLPVLNFALSGCLAARFVCDSLALDHKMRLQRAGAQLPRALELALLFAAFVQAAMGWVVLRVSSARAGAGDGAGASGGVASEATFLVVSCGIAWALFGYTSFKCSRARDCCCGAGEAAAGAAGAPARAALRRAHSTYMRGIFGAGVFDEAEDTFDETEGRPFAELVARAQHSLARGVDPDAGTWLELQAVCASLVMRGEPYFSAERNQQPSHGDAPSGLLSGGARQRAGAWWLSGSEDSEEAHGTVPLGPVFSVPQLRAWTERCAEAGWERGRARLF
jgi:hypothetical protein